MTDIDNKEETISGLEYVYIELPKYKPENYKEEKNLNLWQKFLTSINENTNAKDISKELSNNNIFKEALDICKRNLSYQELNEYDELNEYAKDIRKNHLTFQMEKYINIRKNKQEEIDEKMKKENEEKAIVINHIKLLKRIGYSNKTISIITKVSEDTIEKI